MGKCYSCGRAIEDASAYSRIRVGTDVFLICCPMCMTASEAGHIQRRMIPSSFATERAAVFVGYQPALHVGGDYVCVRRLGDEQLCAVVADISGHGVTSSLVMSRLSGEIEALIGAGADLADIAFGLNRSVRALAGEQRIFLTLFGSVLDFRTRQLAYVNCGHPGQLLWSKARSGYARLESNGIPVGLFGPDRFSRPEICTVSIGRGDKLVLFTDGILDLERDGAPLEEDGLVRTLRDVVENPQPVPADTAFADLKRLQGKGDDDLLLVVIDIKELVPAV
jgi:serine phosphatase RsbU (regulator of sigma subunit)